MKRTFFASALAVLLFANIAGFISHRVLRSRLFPTSATSPSEWVPPKILDNIPGQDLDGQPYIVNYDHSRVVLFVFAPIRCPLCPSLMEYWNEITESVASTGISTIGVAVEAKGLKKFLKSYPANFPIIHSVPKKVLMYNRLTNVPSAIIVSQGGNVDGFVTSLDSAEERARFRKMLGD